MLVCVQRFNEGIIHSYFVILSLFIYINIFVEYYDVDVTIIQQYVLKSPNFILR